MFGARFLRPYDEQGKSRCTENALADTAHGPAFGATSSVGCHGDHITTVDLRIVFQIFAVFRHLDEHFSYIRAKCEGSRDLEIEVSQVSTLKALLHGTQVRSCVCNYLITRISDKNRLIVLLDFIWTEYSCQVELSLYGSGQCGTQLSSWFQGRFSQIRAI